MRLSLSLFIDLSQFGNGIGKFSMADWADDVLAKLRKQQEQKQLQDAVFLERQQIKKAQGLPLWREVRQKVKENCDALNVRSGRSLLRFGVGQERELVVASEIDTRRDRLNAHFDEEAGSLSWTCGEKSGQWDIAVLGDGSARFQNETVSMTPELIAKQLLETLVFG
jgi:hypothetical protein